MDPLNVSLASRENFTTLKPNTFYVNGVAWSLAFAIEAFLVVLFNTLTIITFAKNKRMQRKSMYCLMNLALADLSVGLMTMPLYVAYLSDNLSHKRANLPLELCLDVIYEFTASVATFSLVLVALERMYVTLCPLRHRRTTSRAYLYCITITWLISVANTLIYYALKYIVKKPRVIFYVLLPILFISLFLICISYGAVFIKIRIRGEDALIPRRIQQERKLVHTFFFVTATSLVTWLPFTILQILSFGGHLRVSADVVFGVLLIQCVNSLINPIIYVFRIREFRKALHRLMCGRTSRLSRHRTEFIRLAKLAVPMREDLLG